MSDFDKINRCNVSITSLRRQLSSATSIDELTIIAGKIIDLEHEIMTEKIKTNRALEKRKKEIEKRIDILRRKLNQAEEELSTLKDAMKRKTMQIKESLNIKIDILNKEYTNISDTLSSDK